MQLHEVVVGLGDAVNHVPVVEVHVRWAEGGRGGGGGGGGVGGGGGRRASLGPHLLHPVHEVDLRDGRLQCQLDGAGIAGLAARG